MPLAGIIFLSVAAQWCAWRLKIPSILLLLTIGILVGPIAGAVLPASWLPTIDTTEALKSLEEDQPVERGLIRPKSLLGDALLPFVSLAVSLILFEGGLTLRISEIKPIGWAFARMAFLGSFVTWVLGSLLFYGIFNLFGLGPPWSIAILLGAILIVTGPTVIGPLLRHIRPTHRVSNLLKWESIVIDPVGAILAVFVFEVAVANTTTDAAGDIAIGIAKTVLVGGGLGFLGAALVVLGLRNYHVPDNLHNPFVLMLVVSIHATCEVIQHDSGLFAVTVMGVALANQRLVSLQHVIEFKESLRDLLIGVLFIMLSSRLALEDLRAVAIPAVLFMLALVLIVRPLAIKLALLGAKIPWREQAFLAWMAPRGVVAAAVAAAFALELGKDNEAGRYITPVTFVVIIGTVAIYGLTSGPLARWLQLTVTHSRGVLLLGAQSWARELAAVLVEHGCPVQMVDTNRAHVNAARMDKLPIYFGSILSEHARESIDLSEMSQLIAITRNDEVNSLACLRFIELFGRQRVYQLPFGLTAEGRKESVSNHQRGRFLFDPTLTFTRISELVSEGAHIKGTRLTDEFSHDEYLKKSAPLTPLMYVGANGTLTIMTAEANTRRPMVGDIVISLLHSPKETKRPKTDSNPATVETAAVV